MASSASVGRRPRISRIRAYSSSLSPSSRYGCGWSGVLQRRARRCPRPALGCSRSACSDLHQRVDDGEENPSPSSVGPVSASMACSGCGISARSGRRPNRCRRCRSANRSGCPGVGAVTDIAQQHPVLGLELVEECWRRRRSGPRRSSAGSGSRHPGSYRVVQTVVVFSTRSHWSRQMNLRPALRITRRAAAAPRRGSGSRCRCRAPAGRAGRASMTARITGAWAEIAPGPQVVAVGEPAGHDDGVDGPSGRRRRATAAPPRHRRTARRGPRRRRPACRGR